MIVQTSRVAGFRKQSLDHAYAEAPAPDLHRDIRLKDGHSLRVRELRSGDRELLKAFYSGCSSEALRYRFMSSMTALPDSLLDHLADADGFRHVALIVTDGDGDNERIVAEGRYVLFDDCPDTADVAFLVVDYLQRRGIATLLMSELTKIARRNGVTYFSADVLGDNWAMLSLMRKSAHPVSSKVSQGVVHVTIAVAGEDGLPEAA